MRTVSVDSSLILPTLDTKRSGFAMWVKLSWNEIPSHFVISNKDRLTICITIGYNDIVATAKSVKIDDFNVQYDQDGRIVGFDLPSHKFHTHLQNFTKWVKDQIVKINNPSVAMNYKFIFGLLVRHVDELFVPPQ